MKTLIKPNEHVVGGWLLICGSLLLTIARVLIALLPQMPSDPSEILAWTQQNGWLLAISDELLCFSVPLLVPGVIILFRAIKPLYPISSLIACSSFMIATAGLIYAMLAEGRLVYPVNTITLTTENAVMAASSLFAGLHFAALAMTFSIVVFGYTFNDIKILLFSVTVGALQILGTYYAGTTPVWLLLVAAVAFLAWASFVGTWLMRRDKKTQPSI